MVGVLGRRGTFSFRADGLPSEADVRCDREELKALVKQRSEAFAATLPAGISDDVKAQLIALKGATKIIKKTKLEIHLSTIET